MIGLSELVSAGGIINRDIFGVSIEYKIDAPNIYIKAEYNKEFEYRMQLELPVNSDDEIDKWDYKICYETYRIIDVLDRVYKKKYGNIN